VALQPVAADKAVGIDLPEKLLVVEGVEKQRLEPLAESGE